MAAPGVLQSQADGSSEVDEPLPKVQHPSSLAARLRVTRLARPKASLCVLTHTHTQVDADVDIVDRDRDSDIQVSICTQKDKVSDKEANWFRVSADPSPA